MKATKDDHDTRIFKDNVTLLRWSNDNLDSIVPLLSTCHYNDQVFSWSFQIPGMDTILYYNTIKYGQVNFILLMLPFIHFIFHGFCRVGSNCHIIQSCIVGDGLYISILQHSFVLPITNRTSSRIARNIAIFTCI